MNTNFFIKQDNSSKQSYLNLLKIVASISKLFSESEIAFLYYRAMENIFCRSFDAVNLSRSDISVDATKNNIGIGLKTFLKNNGNTFQKVAEFNKNSYLFKSLTSLDLVKQISFLRNERIKTTMRICDLNCVIYHIITRKKNYFSICEENIDLIDIDNIKILNEKNNSINFTDYKNEYIFNISKSTLLKRFITKDN